MVTAAQAGKAPVQRLADRISGVFVPIVLALSAATLAGWLLTGHSPQAAFTAAVAVLVIACPCALGLATPTALLVGSGRAAQLGVVIKGPEVLESTRALDTMVMGQDRHGHPGRMSLDVEAAGRWATPRVRAQMLPRIWPRSGMRRCAWRGRSSPPRSTRWPQPSRQPPASDWATCRRRPLLQPRGPGRLRHRGGAPGRGGPAGLARR